MKTQLLKKLSSEIEIRPIFTNNTCAADHKSIIDQKTRKVFSIVGKHYSPIKNETFMNLSLDLQNTGLFKLKGYQELNDGKIVLSFLEFRGPDAKIDGSLYMNGHKYTEYLVLGNSHDGTRPFHVGITSNLARCQNQFYSSIKLVRKKHTKNLIVDEILVKEIVDSYLLGRKSVNDQLDGLDRISINRSTIEQLISDVYMNLYWDSRKPQPGEFINTPAMNLLRNSILKETGDLGMNAFGLFNGVTWYTTHEMHGEQEIFGNTGGTAARINQRAFNFVTELKTKAYNH